MMKTFSMRDVAMACMAMAATMSAHALLNVQRFAYANGTESGPATITYEHVATSSSGDAIQVLSLDATQGGNYVASAIRLATPGGLAGTHVRFRVRAPIVNRVGLRVIDASGQTLQFAIDRSNTVIDDQGWSTVTVPLASPAIYWPTAGNNGTLRGNIVGLQLTLERSGERGKVATAYFRGIEILSAAPTPNDPVLPLHVVDIQPPQLVLGVEQGPVTGTLSTQPLPANSGDDVQAVNFVFPAGSGGYGAAITDITPVLATYAHFRLRAPALSRIRLQVVDSTNQTLQYDIDRTAEVVDSAGWASHGVRLDKPVQFYGGSATGKVEGAIKSVRLLARAPGSSGAPATGTAYFKEVDLLSSAPSPSAPLSPLVTPTQAGPVVIDQVPNPAPGQAAATASVDANAGIEGLTQVLRYDLSKTYPALTPRTSYTGVSFKPVAPAEGNRLRFLAKVPQGVSVRVRLKDETGLVAYQANVVKPLGTVDDAGWVQYVIKLDGDAEGRVLTSKITEIQLGIRRNTNIAVNSAPVQPTGEARFGQVWVGHEADALDLSPDVPTQATLKARNTAPLPATFGVAARDAVVNAALAKSIGFNHLRMDLTWDSTETANGVFDFTAKDAAVKAISDNGLTPILILAYNSRFHTGYGSALTPPNPLGLPPPNTTTWHYGVRTADNLNAYLAFVRQAATRYRPYLNSGKAITFEIWNEPNVRSFWASAPTAAANYAPNPAEYATLVSQATAAIKAIDPRFKVVSAGVARIDFPYLRAITPALAQVDGVSIHPYTTDLDLEPETQGDEILAARALLKAANVSAPLGTTEVGFSSANTGEDGTLEVNRDRQARRVLREVLTSVAVNNPSHVIYQLKDQYPQFPYSKTNGEHNFGVVDKDGLPKPLYKALESVQKSLVGLSYQGLITGNPSNVQAMKFAGPGKDTVFIVWANGLGTHADVSVLPNCQTNFAGAASSGWSSCVMDMKQQPVNCQSLNSNGRYTCPVSEATGPLFIRTRAH